MNNLFNKTKIIATMGPACGNKETLRAMILNGLNVCRLNFSHGGHEDLKKIVDTIRELNEELKVHTAILADLQGPKIRVGIMENNGVEMRPGSLVKFTTKECIGNAEQLYIKYANFPKDVKAKEIILLDDGKLMMEVVSTNKKDEVIAKVLYGGILSSKKGVNLPNTKISLPCLTPKDLLDLQFALDNDISWIAISFVRNPADIIELRKLIDESGKSARIIAKIEKPEAVANIDEIIEQSDALMVARGDLGVEIPMQNVPLVQKEIVNKCQKAARPVIIATQMMESMITNISPTRAEVNDVANAVLDGADAVMLSAETSVGRYPVEVIQAMYKIVLNTETHDSIYNKEYRPEMVAAEKGRFVTDSLCYSAARMATNVGAKAIVTMTFSGYTAVKTSSFRPKARIMVFTSNYKILNMLSLVWGAKGFYYDKFVSTDHTMEDIRYILKKEGYVDSGDFMVHLASMPITSKGTTNMMKLGTV